MSDRGGAHDDGSSNSGEIEAVTASLQNTSIQSSGPTIPPPSGSLAVPLTTPATGEQSSPGLRNSTNPSSGRSSAYQAPTAGSRAPVAKSDLPCRAQTFCPRPERTVQSSKLGKKLLVEANFFKINVAGKINVLQYDIAFKDKKTGKEVTRREFTKKLFWMAVQDNPTIFPAKETMVYNDVNVLFSLEKLRIRGGEQIITIRCGGKDSRFADEFMMKIIYSKMVTIDQATKDHALIQTFLDLLITMRIRCTPCSDSKYFVSHGRSMFYAPHDRSKLDKNLVVDLGRGLQAWTGLHGAVKPDSQLGLLYNVDIGHSVFHRQNYNLVQFFCEVIKRVPFAERDIREHEAELGRCGLNARNRELLNTALKGTTVIARYGNFERSFKFGQVGRTAAAQHQFECEGRRFTIQEYFFGKYNINLNFPYLPCVQIGKKNNWVPMELVYTHTEPFKFKGTIPESQLGRLVRNTAFEPLKRKQIIEKMAAANPEGQEEPLHLSGQDEFMSNFGVSLDREFQKIPATLLPVPTLQFGDNESFTDSEHHGVWDVSGPQFKKVKNPSAKKVVAAIIFIHNDSPDSRNEVDLGGFASLMHCLHAFGVDVPMGAKPFTVQSFSQNQAGGWDTLLGWMKEFKAQVNKQSADLTPLCMFVFPYKCTTRRQKRDDNYFSEYAMVKYICDVVVGIHSQCILREVYGQMKGHVNSCSTAHNVALKVMGKIGAPHYTLERNGAHKNWTVLTNPEEPTLILGVDVTHPGEMDRNQGEHATLSVACVVGNIDIECVQYEQSVRVQAVGQERLVCMKEQLYTRIAAFEKHTGVRPMHIVVYRDGVSETEFQNTLYEEKNSIEMACMDMHPDYKPTLTYIVVSKRHHTRFFPTREEDCEGKAFNLKPGTLVETGVTTASYFDFYLISQFGPLGTSRPTHYYVLHDTWKPSAAFWQTITHALTYCYVRCPKSISQPAPVMYAHLAAKRAKEYLMAYYYTHQDAIARMSNYEKFIKVTENLQRAKDLQGMIFV